MQGSETMGLSQKMQAISHGISCSKTPFILVPWLAPGPVYGSCAAVDRKQVGGS
jgi:hypothetical protein